MADEFPSTQYLNQGNRDPNLGYLGEIGDIFGTGLYGNRNSEPWTPDPQWANTPSPTGGNDPMGGTIYGPSGGAGGYDPSSWEQYISSGGASTGAFTPGGIPVGGPGITVAPGVNVNASGNTAGSWGSTLIGGLASGGLPGAVGAGAGRLLGSIFSGNTLNPGQITPMQPYTVREKRYDPDGNEIAPFDVPNPLAMGPVYNPQTALQMEPYIVNDRRLADQEAARLAAARQQGLANLDAYVGRQIDTGVTTMPPYVVNESSGTGSSTGSIIGSGSGTVSTSNGTISIGSGTSSSTGSGTVSTGSGTSSGTGSGTVGSTPNTFNFSTGPAAPVYTAPNTAATGNRNYYNEGSQSLTDLQRLMPQIAALYGQTAQNVTTSDTNRLRGSVGDMASINYGLTDMAAQQTARANSALRAGNIADAQMYAQQALDLRKQSNPELYAGLSQFQNTAGNQVTSDLARLQQAQTGQLSAEDARNAQQAAREAYAARGLVMGKGAIGAEIMNRDALSRQRQNEARTNLGTSMGQLYQGIGAQTANVFDPMAATLGQQYGMQTQNVGSNQNLFNQAAGLSSGAYGNQYAQQMTNPFNPYAQDVYNTNFNAASAQNIAGMNNAAAIEAARLSGNATTGAANTALWAGLIGSGVRGFGQGLGQGLGG